MAIPDLRADIYALLSLSPLSIPRRELLARLACLIHAANVHSEPESNPSVEVFGTGKIRLRKDRYPELSKAEPGQSVSVPVTVACRPKLKEIELPNFQGTTNRSDVCRVGPVRER